MNVHRIYFYGKSYQSSVFSHQFILLTLKLRAEDGGLQAADEVRSMNYNYKKDIPPVPAPVIREGTLNLLFLSRQGRYKISMPLF
ncbi:MAG: hypothetical protein GY863_08365 [bacterium]|nr:hypothetical protein [bacterium]